MCQRRGWDTHGNNFNCLKEDLLPEFDRGFAALIEDLANRGLLDETLLLVTSEMGRTPRSATRAPEARPVPAAITGLTYDRCAGRRRSPRRSDLWIKRPRLGEYPPITR